VSKQVQTIFKEYTPLVEPLSLDEAYLDITDNLRGLPPAWETAKEIRARINEDTKLTASAGISCNKFLAKLASDYRKPNGQFAIMPDQAEAFVATLPVAKFHGVGPKTTARMHALGIETGADLRRWPVAKRWRAEASESPQQHAMERSIAVVIARRPALAFSASGKSHIPSEVNLVRRYSV
jgi:DNA polymerase IV